VAFLPLFRIIKSKTCKVKKNFLFILILFFSISTASAQVDFVWGKQFGTDSDERTRNLMADSINNVYVVSKTNGKVGKEQFGTSNWDGINGLSVIQDKGVVVSGCMNNPMCQSFCKMYNEDGSLAWSRNFIAQGGRGTCGLYQTRFSLLFCYTNTDKTHRASFVSLRIGTSGKSLSYSEDNISNFLPEKSKWNTF